MITQFERAMKEINIEVIHANSPQAKGRIENLFGTLQDRLVKELRLAEINDVAMANRFLQDKFLPAFNTRFCVVPRSDTNVHRLLSPKEDLLAILSVQTKRYINEDFTIRFKNQWLQLTKIQPTLVLPKAQVTIEERLDNTIYIRLNNYYLTYVKLTTKPVKTEKPPIALTSNPNQKLRTYNTPSPNHPWRKYVLLPYNVTSKPSQKPLSKKIT